MLLNSYSTIQIRSVERCICPIANLPSPQWPNCSYTIRPLNKGCIAYFYCACAIRPYFYFRSKIWRHRRVPRFWFPAWRENFGDSHKFKADIRLLISAWILRTSRPKMSSLQQVPACWYEMLQVRDVLSPFSVTRLDPTQPD